MKNMGIAAVVILYNPTNEIYRTLKSYKSQFEKIVYVDNSSKVNEDMRKLSCLDDKIVYFFLGKNEGLAYALEYGCRYVRDINYKYVCLLDQDTYLSKNCIDKLNDIMQSDKSIGLVAPNIINLRRDNTNHLVLNGKPLYPRTTESVAWAITSGSLIDLDIYKSIGGVDVCLFIGQIDQDYCCNLLSHGYDIKRVGDALIYQEAGRLRNINFGGRKIKDPQYPAERYFYIFRNERYLRRKWRNCYNKQRVRLWKYVVIIILSQQECIMKLLECVRGWVAGGRRAWNEIIIDNNGML